MLCPRPTPFNGRAPVLSLSRPHQRTLPRNGFVLRPVPAVAPSASCRSDGRGRPAAGCCEDDVMLLRRWPA